MSQFFAPIYRWGHLILLEVIEGGLIYRAKALVYTTLLSIVPLLAVSFSVLKAFGFHNKLEPLLWELFAPLGENGAELTDNIIGFVENVNVGVLGSVGIVLLIYSVVDLLEIIKNSFNKIWRTEETRPWLRRVSDSLSILLIGPVLVFSAVGVMASMANTEFVQQIIASEPFGTVYYLLGVLIPYVFIISAFTFVYLFMPSTRVKLSSAFIGAFFAGLAWKAAGWVFATFIVQSASYNAIYSSFAIVILFMFWLYVSWVILLVGGVISFYVQNPMSRLYAGLKLELGNRQREVLGFCLMYLIGESFYKGKEPWTSASLADRIRMPSERIAETLQLLEKNGLLVSLTTAPVSFLPSRALDAIALRDIYYALRRSSKIEKQAEQLPPDLMRIQNMTRKIEESACLAIEGQTLLDLALSGKEIESS
ncbi:MAG: YihY/virulence factor BrkB family protein [Gammaproteobacteria bacterium]